MLAILLGIIFQARNVNAQDKEPGLIPKKSSQATESYFDILINGVNSGIHYGKSNSAFSGYSKSVRGFQAGVSLQAGITHRFSLSPELYVIMKGGKLEAGNPLTGQETTLRFYHS